ncbi:MAG: ergothioneine biosynthesis protein EgtC [Alphaproteobacteria bacterium]
MCRLLAYLGPAMPLASTISEPEHALVHQSYKPREMTSGTVNVDGYGVAWWDRERRDEPYLYRSTLPIWNDNNLGSLGDYVVSNCMLANVRGATPGQSLGADNTQPFAAGPLAAIHNGFVEDFRNTMQRELRRALDEHAYASVAGSSDSENLIAYLFQHMRGAASLSEGMRAGLDGLLALAPGVRMTLNFIVSDGEQLIASRLASGAEAPSLYRLTDHPRFPQAVLIASEPLFDDDAWTAVPQGSLISVDRKRSVTIDALAA